MTRRELLALAALPPPQYEESRGETPWVPSPDDVIETMLRMAKVTPADTVFDLGSGDGRVVIMAAKKFGARAVGVEIDHERVVEATAAARSAGVGDRVRFVEQDFHKADFSSATVVTMYLYTRVMAKLKPKLLTELKPGTRIVAYQFNGMGDWKPVKSMRRHGHRIWLWVR